MAQGGSRFRAERGGAPRLVDGRGDCPAIRTQDGFDAALCDFSRDADDAPVFPEVDLDAVAELAPSPWMNLPKASSSVSRDAI